MPASQHPTSVVPGKQGGTGPYLVGVVVLGALAAGLFWWKTQQGAPPPPPAPTVTATPILTTPPPPPPPPPPPTADPTAEPSAAASAQAKAPPGGLGGPLPKGGCGGKCGDGVSSAALESAVRAAAGSAQGCYQRALRTSEVSGSMMVGVQVGATGQVCGVSISNDTVHSNEIASCVKGKFSGRSFPAPQSGCVVVQVPITFAIKQ